MLGTQKSKKAYYRKLKNRELPIISHIFSFISQLKLARFGWRIFFAAVLLFYIFTGESFLNFATKWMHAEEESLGTINFYIRNAVVDSIPSDPSVGIHFEENILGVPELGPQAEALDFSSINSVAYSGGGASILLSGFEYLSEDKNEDAGQRIEDPESADLAEQGVAAESQDEDAVPSVEGEDFGATEPDETTVEERLQAIDEKYSDQMGDATEGLGLPAAGSESDEGSGSEGDGTDAQISDGLFGSEAEREVEIVEDQDDVTGVEIITQEAGNEDNSPLVDMTQPAESQNDQANTGAEEESISLNLFGSAKEVNAQEFINETITDFAEFGQFISAKLNFSLAVRHKTDNSTQEAQSQDTTGENLVEEQSPVIPSQEPVEESAEDEATNDEPGLFGGLIEMIIGGDKTEVVDMEESEQSVEIKPEDDTARDEVIEGEGSEQSGSDGISYLDKFFKAASAQDAQPMINVWYSFDTATSPDGMIWQMLDSIDAVEIDNFRNNGYFSFDFPALEAWDSIAGLQIKLEGTLGEDEDWLVFIDSAWLSVDYDQETELEKLKKRQRWEEAIQVISNKQVFKTNEEVKMRFRYNKNENRIWDTLSELMGLGDFWQDVEVKLRLLDSEEQEVGFSLLVLFDDAGEFSITIEDQERELRPGLYQIEMTIVDSSGDEIEELKYYQDFSWGVLAFNTNKSVYVPGEEAYLQFAVLDDKGHTVCDADLMIEITKPDGQVEVMRTASGGITRNPECGPDNVIDTPDYYSYFDIESVGEYAVRISAATKNGYKEISDSFSSVPAVDYSVERIGPTRINPWSDYAMEVVVTANSDFTGTTTDYLPRTWNLVDEQVLIKNTLGMFVPYEYHCSTSSDHYVFWQDRNEKELVLEWGNLKMLQGEEIKIVYHFDAPNISPEFYLLGPLQIHDASISAGIVDQGNADNLIFAEARQWQVASDLLSEISVVQSIGLDSGTTDTVNWKTIATSTAAGFVGGETYFVYVTAGFAGSTNAVNTDFEIVYGSSVQFTGLIEPSYDAYDSSQITWFDVMTQPVTPQDIIIRYRTNSGASYALNAQIMAINLSDLSMSDWEFGENTTLVQHSTTKTPRASLTLADADGTKDWLVFGMEQVIVDSTTRSYGADLYDGTTPYMNMVQRGKDATEVVSFTLMRPFVDVAQNTVFSLRDFDVQNSNNDHQLSRVFALNLDVFEDKKTYYGANNTALGTWTEIGNLNTGGNYAPQHAGDQVIFSSWINQTVTTAAGYNDRLQVNNTTVPSGWSWAQSPVPSRTNYVSTDYLANNIMAVVSMPTSGQTIDLDATEITGTTQVAAEVSLTAFSIKKKSIYRPTAIINSATARQDTSGVVDISVDADDLDDDQLRLRVEFATGTTCVFSPSGDATLDQAPANISATFGTVQIDNASLYQVGTSSGWIETTSGTNTVQFDWDSILDLPAADDTYCLRVTANDILYDQAAGATTTVVLDNVAPTVPGALSVYDKLGGEIILEYGDTTTETNFIGYKIFYKISDGTAPDEDDFVRDQGDDVNLGDILFNDKATTSISGLTIGQTYSFSIWAYDSYGHSASSSWIDVVANTAPTSTLQTVQSKTDGSGAVDLQMIVDDYDNQNTLRAKIEYEAGSGCLFEPGNKAFLDATQSNISATFGVPKVDNNYGYQFGTSTDSGYIFTSGGENTLAVDWLSDLDVPDADGEYCVQLTVNDGFNDQTVVSTATVILDNVTPTPTGPLAIGTVTHDSVQLLYNTANPGSDTNEPASNAYRIFFKPGTFGVTEGGTGILEVDDIHLDAYDYSGGTDTTVTGLLPATWYVFNIWTYDSFGNRDSATEISVLTNDTVKNESLSFVNALSDGIDSNIAIADSLTEQTIRAVVTEVSGYAGLNTVTLRLADKSDEVSPFSDLVFTWNQANNIFSETGTDILDAVSISNNSSSDCVGNTCTLDFEIIYNKSFASSSWDYSAELYSTADGGGSDFDSYTDLFQVRFSYLAQTHYRWRNDDGGE